MFTLSERSESKGLRLGGLPESTLKLNLRSANLRDHAEIAGVFNRLGGKNHAPTVIHWENDIKKDSRRQPIVKTPRPERPGLLLRYSLLAMYRMVAWKPRTESPK